MVIKVNINVVYSLLFFYFNVYGFIYIYIFFFSNTHKKLFFIG